MNNITVTISNVFLLISELDLDNITIPTTVSGLCQLIPDYLPVHLVCSPKPCIDMPNYVPVGTCGVTIYACATFEQKEAACQYISTNGPPALPSQSSYLFSTSTLPISAGELFEAFTRANISRVGIFVYGMKFKRYMHRLHKLPPPPDPDNAVLRLDIGCNCQHRGVPLFSLAQGARGHVSSI